MWSKGNPKRDSFFKIIPNSRNCTRGCFLPFTSVRLKICLHFRIDDTGVVIRAAAGRSPSCGFSLNMGSQSCSISINQRSQKMFSFIEVENSPLQTTIRSHSLLPCCPKMAEKYSESFLENVSSQKGEIFIFSP